MFLSGEEGVGLVRQVVRRFVCGPGTGRMGFIRRRADGGGSWIC